MNNHNGYLRSALQARLLDRMIRKVGSEISKWKVLVVDRAALRILAAALQINDLVNEGVTVVEMLDMRREALPRLPAIYFITPTPESIQHLVQESPTQYKEFHLFFTSRLPDFQMGLIRQNTALLRRVRALVELNIEFLALESRLFSLDRPASSLPQIYGTSSADTRQEMTVVSERLAEACALVAPTVDWDVRNDAASNNSRVLATLVKQQLDIAKGEAAKDANAQPDQTDKPTKATLLILDRATDMVTPLVHEFSYQSIAHDLLKLNYRKPGGAHVELPEKEGSEKMESIQIDDEEKDPVWCDIRSLFIEKAMLEAQARFKTFLETDAAYKIRDKEAGTVDIKEMSAAVRSLPNSQMLADKYAMHIRVAKQCLSLCSELKLTQLALVEQDLVMGKYPDGTKMRAEPMVKNMADILSDPEIPLVHRVRLLMIAMVVADDLVSLGGLKSLLSASGTFQSRLKRSKFKDQLQGMDPRDSAAIKGVRKVLEAARVGFENYAIEHNMLDTDDTVKAMFKNKYALRQAQRQQVKENKAREKRHGLTAEEPHPYDVARYHPPLRSVMMDLVDEELDEAAFPSTNSLSVDSILASLSSTPASDDPPLKYEPEKGGKKLLRNLESNGSTTSGGSSDEQSPRLAERGHLYVIFVLGGVSYAEVKAMHEVCAKRQADIIIGGSQVLTPERFMDALSAITDPVLRIRIMLPPLPIELAQSRAAKARTLQAGAAKQKKAAKAAEQADSPGGTGARADRSSTESEEGQQDAEVVVGYKKNRHKRFFGLVRK